MFINIAIVGVVLIGGILGLAATKPNTFRIARATRVNAPPEKIFSLINDLHRWESWSPYEKRDPALKRTHSGAANGKGAVYEWEGNKKVGQGRMEITDSAPASKITIKLDFFKPFEAHNFAEFTLEPEGSSTHVTWAMSGPNLCLGKVMSLFLSMDKMVGKDFEIGLANLKANAER
jgi:uncharacterized protein YndB with AHSA1/START domain